MTSSFSVCLCPFNFFLSLASLLICSVYSAYLRLRLLIYSRIYASWSRNSCLRVLMSASFYLSYACVFCVIYFSTLKTSLSMLMSCSKVQVTCSFYLSFSVRNILTLLKVSSSASLSSCCVPDFTIDPLL